MAPDTLIDSPAILWTILALGLAALFVFLERLLTLHRSRIDETDLLSGIFNNLKRGNHLEAIQICDETPGPVAHIVGEAIRHRDLPRADLVSVLHSEGLSEISRMERRLSALSIIAQTTPFLGLLGTLLPLLGAVLKALNDAPFVQSAGFLAALRPALTTGGLLLGCFTFSAERTRYLYTIRSNSTGYGKWSKSRFNRRK